MEHGVHQIVKKKYNQQLIANIKIMITKTYKEIREFKRVGNIFLARDKNQNTKLGYAVSKLINGPIDAVTKEHDMVLNNLYNEIVLPVMLNEALTDKATGEVFVDPKLTTGRPFKFDKKGLTAVIEAERKNREEAVKIDADYDLKEFEIQDFIVSDIPENLSEGEREVFTGFVI